MRGSHTEGFPKSGHICRFCLPYLVQDDFGDTALLAAVNEGHLHVAEILVKNGADVNYRNKVRALIPGTQVCTMWPMIIMVLW